MDVIGFALAKRLDQDITPSQATWSAQLNRASSYYGPGGAAHGGYWYNAGGTNGSVVADYVNRYNPATDTWTGGLALLPAGRNKGTLTAASNGRLYFYGGSTSTVDFPTSGERGELYEYDPVANVWTTKAAGSTRVQHSATAVDSRVFVMGGYSGGSATNTTAYYDPATNTWAAGPTMPATRVRSGADTIYGKVYTAGGFDNGARTTATWMLDPVAGTWTTKAALNVGRDTFGLAAVRDKLYVLGGYDQAGSVTGRLDEYNSSTNSWSNLAAGAPQAGAAYGTAVIGTSIYAQLAGNSALPYRLDAPAKPASLDNLLAYLASK